MAWARDEWLAYKAWATLWIAWVQGMAGRRAAAIRSMMERED